MVQNHHYATTDEQEEEAIRLAMALSAEEAGRGAQPQARPAAPPRAPAPAPPRPALQQPPRRAAAPSPPAAAGAAGGLLRALRAGLSAGAEIAGVRRCASCGGAATGIGEPILEAQGSTYHAGCFRCAGCGQPLAAGGGGFQYTVHQETRAPYHQSCYRQRFHPRCSVCHEMIPESGNGTVQWSYQPFWKDSKFCPAHSRDGTPSCCSCGRLEPRGAEWVVLQDRERRLCLECLGTVVIDTADAQPLYREVLEFFRAQGMPHPYAPPLLLVESAVLEDHASRETGRRRGGEEGPIFHVRGLCVATIYTSIPAVSRIGHGFGVSSVATALGGGPLPPGATQRVSVQSLLVLYGLPRLLCGSIVAHELTHAWIRMQGVASIDPHVEEGLCQLMAYLWLESQDYAAKRAGPEQERFAAYLGNQIRTDTSPIYGDGFRAALELYQVRGLRALFDHVLRYKAWPSWHA